MRVVSHTSGRNVDALRSTAEWPLIFSARGVCYVPGVVAGPSFEQARSRRLIR